MNRMNMNMQAREGGFTLIEIAIVLVIIGLLLGGVLQGQQLIENSRVKNATNTFNGIAAAAFSYQGRYGRMPGDDGNTAALDTRGATGIQPLIPALPAAIPTVSSMPPQPMPLPASIPAPRQRKAPCSSSTCALPVLSPVTLT